VNVSDEAFSVQEGSIRFGLAAVKGVGKTAVEAILEARRAGAFRSLYDFCERIDLARVNRKCIEALIQAGALEGLGGHRAQHLAALPIALEWAARVQKERTMGQVSLFSAPGEEAAPPRHPVLPQEREWGSAELLRREKEALGFYVSGHPLEEHRRLLERMGVVPIHLLETLPDNEAILVAGLPAQIRKSVDKRGNMIAFLTLEDFTGTVECLVFNDAYRQCGALLALETPLLVRGRVSTREDQKPKLRVEEAVALSEMTGSGQLTLHLALPRSADSGMIEGLRRLLDAYPGPSPVWLHVDHRSLEGVQMRLRGRGVNPQAALLDELTGALGAEAIRVTVGEPHGTRSQEIFLIASPT
jgi:DNA polymerase-3 subunit alpha